MIYARIIVAVATATILATSSASAQNDLRPHAKSLMHDDAWCPIALNHHLPAVTTALVEFVRKSLSESRDIAVYEAVSPLLETLLSVGKMDERDPVRQAHVAMACSLGLPVVKKTIARGIK